jgi:hypothetical protein
MLAAATYQMSSDDLLCAVEARRKGIARNKVAAFRKARPLKQATMVR